MDVLKININGNGQIDQFDYINLLRYICLTLTSVILGYTISDFNPEFFKLFTTPFAQFCIIFIFLMTGLVKIKGNSRVKKQTVVMGCVSLFSVFVLQSMKKQSS